MVGCNCVKQGQFVPTNGFVKRLGSLKDGFLGKGVKLLLANLIDSAHCLHSSTVSYVLGVKDQQILAEGISSKAATSARTSFVEDFWALGVSAHGGTSLPGFGEDLYPETLPQLLQPLGQKPPTFAEHYTWVICQAYSSSISLDMGIVLLVCLVNGDG